MKSMLQQINARIGRRGIAAAVLLLLVLLAAVATPQLLGARVAAALDTVGTADAKWLWLAGVGSASRSACKPSPTSTPPLDGGGFDRNSWPRYETTIGRRRITR